MRKIVLVTISLLVGANVLADAPHYYSVAKVKIILSNEKEKIGYTPIYSGDEITGLDDENVKEKRIKFSGPNSEVSFVENIYSISNTYNVVAMEELEEIPIKNIDKIIILSWENISGACDFQKLPKKEINRLLNNPIVCSISVPAMDIDADYIYFNFNPNITKKEMEYFLNLHSRGTGYNGYDYDKYIINLYGMMNSDYATVKYNLRRAMDEYKLQYNKFEKDIIEIEPGLLMNKIKRMYSLQKKFYEAFRTSLINKEIDTLIDFVRTECNQENYEEVLGIAESFEKEDSILEKLYEISQPFYKKLMFRNQVKRILMECDFVKHLISWD